MFGVSRYSIGGSYDELIDSVTGERTGQRGRGAASAGFPLQRLRLPCHPDRPRRPHAFW